MKDLRSWQNKALLIIALIFAISSCARQSDEEFVLESVLEISEEIDRSFNKESIHGMIANQYAKIGQYDIACKIAEGIADSSLKEISYWWIVAHLAEDGKFNEALEMAKAIKEGKAKSNALSDIAAALAEDEQYEFALSLADSITDSSLRTWALVEIAKVSLEKGKSDDDLMTLAYAFDFAKSVNEQEARDISLGKVAHGYAIVLDFEKALAIADSIDDGDQRAKTWIMIVQECIDSGDSSHAITILNDVYEFAEAVEDRKDIDVQRLLASIGVRFFLVGECEKGIRIVRSLDRDILQIRALAIIGREYKEKGKVEEAYELFEEAYNIADKKDDEYYRILGISSLADEYAEAEESERAIEILGKALGSSRELEEGYKRETGVLSIAHAYVGIGEYERALEISNELRGPNQAMILLGIVEHQKESGKKLGRKERQMINEMVASNKGKEK